MRLPFQACQFWSHVCRSQAVRNVNFSNNPVTHACEKYLLWSFNNNNMSKKMLITFYLIWYEHIKAILKLAWMLHTTENFHCWISVCGTCAPLHMNVLISGNTSPCAWLGLVHWGISQNKCAEPIHLVILTRGRLKSQESAVLPWERYCPLTPPAKHSPV